MQKAAVNDNIFIGTRDQLAAEINTRANELYRQLLSIDASQLDTADEYKQYFIKHHLGRRLYFSLQSSAHIIYHSVKICGKPVNETVFIDYGAGLGTLFMLAGKMGFKKTVYNDYFPEWHQPAKVLCNALEVTIDDYVDGDIDNVVKDAAAKNIQYDIVASRNVIEHIYDLPVFYRLLYGHNPKAVIYSSTTANYHNPAMHLQHILIHKKADKNIYRPQRINEAKKLRPGSNDTELNKLADVTRGKAKKDFIDAVNNFAGNKPVAKDKTLRTNTCDCITGVWIEHLLTKNEHAAIAAKEGFTLYVNAGFWDTHYRYGIINLFTACFNGIISLLGKKKGITLAPFIDIIAYN